MKSTKEKVQLKGKVKRPLSDYLKKESDIETKSIRADRSLWSRIEKLSHKYDCSQNEAVVAALTKACDEENV